MGEELRLQKFLSAAGVASRRKSEGLIVAGRVSVDGQVVTELGTKVDPTSAIVEVDGQRVMPPSQPHYLMMNKPRATVCTENDPEGRQRVHDLLPEGLPRLFTVGRLDYDTEGLLLFTNDGEFAARLTSPNKAVPRVYEVKIQGGVDTHLVRRWTEGVRLDDGTVTRPAPTEVIARTRTNAWYSVVLSEGKNRQIHRMAAACGKRVLKLRRVSYGTIQLGALKPGTIRKLTASEVHSLMSAVGLSGTSAASRGVARMPAKAASSKPAGRSGAKPANKPVNKGAGKPAAKPGARPADKAAAKPGSRRGPRGTSLGNAKGTRANTRTNSRTNSSSKARPDAGGRGRRGSSRNTRGNNRNDRG